MITLSSAQRGNRMIATHSPPHRPPPRLCTIAEVADRLRVSTKSVRRWIAASELGSVRIGRQIRLAQEDIAVFLAHGRNNVNGV
jgi:excisionase family DNA binding protein